MGGGNGKILFNQKEKKIQREMVTLNREKTQLDVSHQNLKSKLGGGIDNEKGEKFFLPRV